jgi:NADH:ubiquinone oxidoreductase subunit K
MVRESADRNTLEQQELLEDLRAFGKNVKIIAILALVLAAAGFFMTLALLLRMYKVLP